ncbi:hypothetical protein KL930_004124 [Ogataea haglerorum]|nr:hypothetical protein KL914_000687 [Ogataea haglerorum]KAG7712817.1 hypothetical protein KL950_000688 [Ogataea haglerorum]KAG7742466.1 hypothetical protein KL923_000081 [Ogataea haglerorum]KAG7745050.1 hypothetical protein KL932_000080 [Ogataea haglerorum]KAG7774294.1 hypothetical protein KL930_004124 [Ogataea haglerorum]
MLNRALFVTRARRIPLVFARTVVFHRRRKPQRQDPKKIENSLSEQIKNLEKLTQQVQTVVKAKQDVDAQQKAMEDLHINDSIDDSVDEEAEALFEALLSSNSAENPLLLEEGPRTETMSIFPPAEPHTALPASIREKLDPETVKHITVAAGANWVPVVDRLHQTTGLAGSRPIDVVQFVTKIPRPQRPLVVAKIHDMAMSAGLLENVHIYNTIMSCYNMASAEQARPIRDGEPVQQAHRRGQRPQVYAADLRRGSDGYQRGVHGCSADVRAAEQVRARSGDVQHDEVPLDRDGAVAAHVLVGDTDGRAK